MISHVVSHAKSFLQKQQETVCGNAHNEMRAHKAHGQSFGLFSLLNVEGPSASHPCPHRLIGAQKPNVMMSVFISHVL